jgi:low temperature requirement protein LtrA
MRMNEPEPQLSQHLSRAHPARRMTGRDPQEEHRASTPLELLFDLTFTVAFGVAATQLAHGFADNHVAAALPAFGFCVFAISWAWINFSWFASAYDTNDWIYRLMTSRRARPP